MHEAIEIPPQGGAVVGRQRGPYPAGLHRVPRRLQVALTACGGGHPVGRGGTGGIARELLGHAVLDLLIDDLALEVGPRPGVSVEGARPPVEHTFATFEVELLGRQHRLEHIRRGSRRIVEKERFAEADDELAALAWGEALRVDAAEPLARALQMVGHPGLAVVLEVRAGGNEVGAVGVSRIAAGLLSSFDGCLELALVVEQPGAKQRIARLVPGGRVRSWKKQRDGDEQSGYRAREQTHIRMLSPLLVQFSAMAEPKVIPRQEHTLSRRDIDPDALKVLYRLRQHDHIAYLVGGSVRDLLLGRRPKDFDIGTSAHPYQVKKLFRNCWIIGRRFRLAHVRFGPKVVEVATFRRQVQPGEEIAQDGVPVAHMPESTEQPHLPDQPYLSDPASLTDAAHVPDPAHLPHRPAVDLIHRDNTFGTAEEDAFRRDFTINALFYDIATFSIIDYVGGLDDLRSRVVRAIGDPEVRFREDPVRMLRAIALASRLDFDIDQPILDAIAAHRHEIARSSPPRLLEEYYKILRSGTAERTFRGLLDAGLLEPISEELHRGADTPLWRSLAALDQYRAKFTSIPETLTNAVLLGSLLVPLGRTPQAGRHGHSAAPGETSGRHPPAPRLGALPLARRDIERLRQIQSLQRRLRDLGASVRVQRGLTHRSIFREGLTWMEIHGNMPEIVEHWITVLADRGVEEPPLVPTGEEDPPPRRRRRRRRRRYRPAQES